MGKGMAPQNNAKLVYTRKTYLLKQKKVKETNLFIQQNFSECEFSNYLQNNINEIKTIEIFEKRKN